MVLTQAGRVLIVEPLGLLVAYVLRVWRTLLTEASVAWVLIFLSLRTYLFGHGYYVYADRTWPPSNSILPSGYFNPTVLQFGVPNLPQFTRDFVTFPYLAIVQFASDSILTEKLFVVYLFLVLIASLYLLAGLVVRLIEKVDTKRMGFLRREVTKGFLVLLGFTNFYIVNANVDGGAITDSLSVIAIAAVAIGALTFERSRVFVPIAIVTGSAILLLDSQGFPLYLVAAFIGLLIRGIIDCKITSNLRSFCLITVGLLPVGFFVAYALSATLVPGGPFSQYRTFDLSSAQYYAANLTPWSALATLGFDWSILSFGPPTIVHYSANLSSLPSQGYPPQILLPPGLVTSLWLVATLGVSALTISSLLGPYRRRIGLVVGAMLAFGLVMTQYPWIPGLARLMILLFQLPLIGSPLGTTFIQPERFLSIVAASYVIGATVGFHTLTTRRCLAPSPAPTATGEKVDVLSRAPLDFQFQRLVALRSSSRFRQVSQASIAVFLGCVVIFSGWQSLDGDFYPSRAQVLWQSGNGVPDSAPFYPEFNAGIVATFNFLEVQPGSFNIYWPDSGTTSSGWAYSQHTFNSGDGPKPQVTLPALPFLVRQRLFSDVSTYLREQAVGYVVASDGPSQVLSRDFGPSRFGQVLSALNSTPGLNLSHDFDGFYVYKVSDPGPTEFVAGISAKITNSSEPYGPAYAAFETLGQNIAITYGNQGISLGINDSSTNLSLLTPDYLANLNPSAGVSLNSTTNAARGLLTPHTEAFIGNWSLFDGATSTGQIADASYAYSNANLALSSSSPTEVILSFNGTLSLPSGGVLVPSPSTQIVSAVLSFSFSSGGSNVSSGDVSPQAWNVSGGNWGSVIEEFGQRTGTSQISASTLYPSNTSKFTIRIEIGFVGAVDLQNVVMNWSFLSVAPDTPLGLGWAARDGELRFVGVHSSVVLCMLGNGSANGRTFRSSNYQVLALPLPADGLVKLSGNLTIAFVLLNSSAKISDNTSPALVLLTPYNPGYFAVVGEDRVRSSPGIEDINVFLGVNSTAASIVYEPTLPILVGYTASITYMVMLTLFSVFGLFGLAVRRARVRERLEKFWRNSR